MRNSKGVPLLIALGMGLAIPKPAAADLAMHPVEPYGPSFPVTLTRAEPSENRPPFEVISGWPHELDPSWWSRVLIAFGIREDPGHRVTIVVDSPPGVPSGIMCKTVHVQARLAKFYKVDGVKEILTETGLSVSHVRCLR